MIVFVSPTEMVPSGIPSDGAAPGVVMPSIVTLFGTKIVPLGVGSVTTTFVAGTVPLFVNVTV
ncbi:hypothetical protein bcere0013_33840 [Bacillus cereus BDRD-ST26]|nr:hypothetical protein bcere0013_33840 [Bacillus cereus BDRD-ST26]KZD45949.1 hypothetical protein B4085_4521 [Bacillus cereus]KZD70053.1 hypothetical protein B4116_0143 [Bacillus cereus]CKF63674.1 Uncharacterised protein [Bacillus paranthracis]CKG36809.1 Uncharacterised protein [Streptococcus pneumoniae]